MTHAGLLRVAISRRCQGIHTSLQERQCDPIAGRWVFKATVHKGGAKEDSSGTATPIPPTFRLWSAAPRCAWLRRVPSIEPCARLTASGCARLKSSGSLIAARTNPRVRQADLVIRMEMVLAMGSPDCGINSAF